VSLGGVTSEREPFRGECSESIGSFPRGYAEAFIGSQIPCALRNHAACIEGNDCGASSQSRPKHSDDADFQLDKNTADEERRAIVNHTEQRDDQSARVLPNPEIPEFHLC
jgi:hypothetical protein